MILIAHAEELHTQTTSTTEHLVTEPLFAVPLFILICLAVYYGLQTANVSMSTIILVELAIFFAVGIGTYTLVPALSIFAITVGIVSALFITLSNLAHD